MHLDDQIRFDKYLIFQLQELTEERLMKLHYIGTFILAYNRM